MRKAERVIAATEAATPPWQHELEGTTLNLVRGDESMQIVWDDKGGLVHPLTYTLRGVREVRLRNVAEALRIIAGTPNYRARRAKSRSEAPAEQREAEAPSSLPLPFDIEESDDKTIIKAVLGKRIVWKNNMNGEYEQGVVPGWRKVPVKRDGVEKVVRRASPNVYLSTTSAGRRVLTFPAVGEQFRSMGLDQIVQVN